MKTFKRWLHQQIDELDQLYSYPDPNVEVWRRSASIVDEAGDRAARLGLTDLFQRSQKFGGYTGPEIAKAFLSECLAAVEAPLTKDQPLTVKEAAGRLRVSAQRVYGLCQAGTLRCLKIGRSVRIAPDEIGRFLAAQTDAAKPEPPPGEYQFLKLTSAAQPSPSPRRRRGSRPAS